MSQPGKWVLLMHYIIIQNGNKNQWSTRASRFRLITRTSAQTNTFLHLLNKDLNELRNEFCTKKAMLMDFVCKVTIHICMAQFMNQRRLDTHVWADTIGMIQCSKRTPMLLHFNWVVHPSLHYPN